MNSSKLKPLLSLGNKLIGFILFVICAIAIYNKVLQNENLNHLNTVKKWEEHLNNNKNLSFLPIQPYQTYKSKGWISWYDFLGKNNL